MMFVGRWDVRQSGSIYSNTRKNISKNFYRLSQALAKASLPLYAKTKLASIAIVHLDMSSPAETPSQQVYNNALIISEVLSRVEKKKDLVFFMDISRDGFEAALKPLYRAVPESTLSEVMAWHCPLVRATNKLVAKRTLTKFVSRSLLAPTPKIHIRSPANKSHMQHLPAQHRDYHPPCSLSQSPRNPVQAATSHV